MSSAKSLTFDVIPSGISLIYKKEISWIKGLSLGVLPIPPVSYPINPIKFNYTLHGHSLEHVISAKYLGCTITSDL
jgi:hypothetical protein